MEINSNQNIVNSSDIYKETNSFLLKGINLLDEDSCYLNYNHVQLENIFKYNPFIQRAITTYPGEITKFFPIINKNNSEKDEELTKRLHKELQKLNTKYILRDVLIKTNIYGSYLIFLKTNSLSRTDKELGENEIITELNPYPFHKVGRDIEILNGIEKITYYIVDGVKIHHSRVIRFDSSPVLHINEPPAS